MENDSFLHWLKQQPERFGYRSIQLIEKAWYDGRAELMQEMLDKANKIKDELFKE